MDKNRIIVNRFAKYTRNLNGFILDVYSRGIPSKSRLGDVYELFGATIEVESGLLPYRPGMSLRLAFIELLQVISGYFDERKIKEAAPNLKTEYGLTHAYGIKIAQQVPGVINQLRKSPGTRRAMIHIGKPEDGFETEKPCMQSYQFYKINGHLQNIVYARSSDLILGLPYDLIVAGGINQMVANLAGIPVGNVTLFAATGHVYKDLFHNIMLGNLEKKSAWPEFFYLPRLDTFRQYREWAIDCLNEGWERFPEGIDYGS